jgi:signal transduction histidine kinase
MRVLIQIHCALLLVFLPLCGKAPDGQKPSAEEEINLLFGAALSYNKEGQYDSARFYLNKALDLPGSREREGGRILVNLANTYVFQGQYAEALRYYLEALKIGEKLEMKATTGEDRRMGQWNIVRTMANLSEVYYMIGNQNQALYYAERANAKIDEIGMGYEYISPQIFYVIGSVYLNRGDLDKAEESMLKTCEIADSFYWLHLRQFGDTRGIVIYKSYGMEGLARVCLARKAYAKALEYARQSLDFAKEYGDPMVMAKAWAVFSDIYMEQGLYETSGKVALRALEVNSGHISLEPSLAFNIAVARLFAGDKKGAYDFLRTYSEQMKKNTDKNFRETMAGMEIQFETEKKEMRISELERQQMFYIFLAVAACALALAIWAVFRHKVRREQAEKQLIASHAVLEGEKKERERLARDLHDGLGGMLSAVKIELRAIEHLPGIRERLNACIEELRRIATGVMPVSLLRFGIRAALEDYCRSFPDVRFHFFGQDRRTDEQIELVLYYCACELVNNSVRHSEARHINVQLIQDDTRISLTVQDDGCGFSKKSPGQGSGLKNIRDRVTAFNGKLDLTTAPGKGTETTIELKIYKSHDQRTNC